MDYVVKDLTTHPSIMDDADLSTDVNVLGDAERAALVPMQVPGVESEATPLNNLKRDLSRHVDELVSLLHNTEARAPVKAAAREELALIEAIKQQGLVDNEHNVHLQVWFTR